MNQNENMSKPAGQKQLIDALISASVNKNLEAVKTLREQGVDINKALLIAAAHNNLEAVKTLTEQGGNVTVGGPDGSNLVVLAIAYENKEMLEFVIEKGAPMIFKNKFENILFHPRNNKEILEILINKKKLDINNLKTKEGGSTLLHAECQKGHFETIQLLVKKGAIVNVKDKNNHTPLLYGMQVGKLDIVDCLIANGASIYEPNNLAGSCYINCIIEKKKDWLIRNNENNKKVVNFNPEFDKILNHIIKIGIFEINTKVEQRLTPLEFAVAASDTQAIKILIEHGASIEKLPPMKIKLLQMLIENRVRLIIKNARISTEVLTEEERQELKESTKENQKNLIVSLVKGYFKQVLNGEIEISNNIFMQKKIKEYSDIKDLLTISSEKLDENSFKRIKLSESAYEERKQNWIEKSKLTAEEVIEKDKKIMEREEEIKLETQALKLEKDIILEMKKEIEISKAKDLPLKEIISVLFAKPEIKEEKKEEIQEKIQNEEQKINEGCLKAENFILEKFEKEMKNAIKEKNSPEIDEFEFILKFTEQVCNEGLSYVNKATTLNMMLHINEDFHDDLLKDAIELFPEEVNINKSKKEKEETTGEKKEERMQKLEEKFEQMYNEIKKRKELKQIEEKASLVEIKEYKEKPTVIQDGIFSFKKSGIE